MEDRKDKHTSEIFHMNMLSEIVKTVGKEYATLASEIREQEIFIDTGSYIFNALVSGSIFGGVSGNKITGIAGESSTGKTFFALAVVKNFLDNNPTGVCLYFDSESAITRKLLVERGIDVNRLVLLDVVTVEDFRSKALKAADLYSKKPEEERIPMLFVLDSLGMLPTNKEVQDTLNDKEVRDMTKASLIKGTFRMLTMKLGKFKIPMIVTNHTYQTMSLYGGPEIGGGCLAAGTKIYARRYNEVDDSWATIPVAIENIEEGDRVLTKEGTYEDVLQTHVFVNKDLLEIEFSNGTTVKCTPEHKFFIDGEWIEAKNLVEGSSVTMLEPVLAKNILDMD